MSLYPDKGALERVLACACCRQASSGEFFTEWEETFESFDQMGLNENLLRGIYAYGEAL